METQQAIDIIKIQIWLLKILK